MVKVCHQKIKHFFPLKLPHLDAFTGANGLTLKRIRLYIFNEEKVVKLEKFCFWHNFKKMWKVGWLLLRDYPRQEHKVDNIRLWKRKWGRRYTNENIFTKKYIEKLPYLWKDRVSALNWWFLIKRIAVYVRF